MRKLAVAIACMLALTCLGAADARAAAELRADWLQVAMGDSAYYWVDWRRCGKNCNQRIVKTDVRSGISSVVARTRLDVSAIYAAGDKLAYSTGDSRLAGTSRVHLLAGGVNRTIARNAKKSGRSCGESLLVDSVDASGAVVWQQTKYRGCHRDHGGDAVINTRIAWPDGRLQIVGPRSVVSLSDAIANSDSGMSVAESVLRGNRMLRRVGRYVHAYDLATGWHAKTRSEGVLLVPNSGLGIGPQGQWMISTKNSRGHTVARLWPDPNGWTTQKLLGDPESDGWAKFCGERIVMTGEYERTLKVHDLSGAQVTLITIPEKGAEISHFYCDSSTIVAAGYDDTEDGEFVLALDLP